MSKIQNLRLRNTEAVISTLKVKFDENGIAEIESPELHAELLTFPNFYAVEDKEENVEPKGEATESADPSGEENKEVDSNAASTEGEEGKELPPKKANSKK